MMGISVIMPIFNQKAFIRRAIKSLFAQTYSKWELIIIDDGSTDDLEGYIVDYLKDSRVLFIRNDKNRGLGHSLNRGLDSAKYNYISYLPADDYFYENHLETIAYTFREYPDLSLVFTNVNSKIVDFYTETAPHKQYHHKTKIGNLFLNHSLQLVQTAHIKTLDRWETREQIISSNLFLLFWYKLVDKGRFFCVNQITCNWTIHDEQHHKIIQQGIGRYKQYYLRNQEKASENRDKLKILIVGDLGHNADRINIFQEAGHELFGLWTSNPMWSATGANLKIRNLRIDSWHSEIKEIKPDIIYALLNYVSVPLAHEVLLMYGKTIPFVWHFKEGPYACMLDGLWNKLIDLYTLSDGKIFISPESKELFKLFIPEDRLQQSMILDGDLPNQKYFLNKSSSIKLSELDNEIHTVVSGRLLGLSQQDIKEISKYKIHIHTYGIGSSPYIQQNQRENSKYFHVHQACPPPFWFDEFSKYDAGWLHFFESKNKSNLMNATWDDLNIPAKLTTMFAAGIPTIQRNNEGNAVVVQDIVRKTNTGVFIESFKELHDFLSNKEMMKELNENVKKCRAQFTFDYHFHELISFFRDVINNKN